MLSAFINGMDSDKQTAGVKSTLVNALKNKFTAIVYGTIER